MKASGDYQELLLRYLDGSLRAEEEAQVTHMLRSSPEARAFLRDVSEQAVTVADLERVKHRRGSELEAQQRWLGDRKAATRTFQFRWPWALATAAIIGLLVSVYFNQPRADPHIATITELSGPVQWTGDGGRVFHDLSVGTTLPGGTLEGMVPGAWVKFTFGDGSTVGILGNSTLTYSEHEQKILHLNRGSLSSKVRPQPAGKPMLVHTRSAVLEVLGTQFEVEADVAVTQLNVSEGEVRVKRLSDGRTVHVPAHHRVTAAADRELQAVPEPEATHQWKSRLHLGPSQMLGKWSPGTDTEGAKLAAIPYTVPQGFTIYVTAFGVSRDDKPLVLLPASHLRVRGKLTSPHPVYFGVTVRRAEGAFAGRFQTIRPADEFQNGRTFAVTLSLQDFQLDPSLHKMKNKLPDNPFDLVVESFWCHTLDKQAGLEISELELLPTETLVP